MLLGSPVIEVIIPETLRLGQVKFLRLDPSFREERMGYGEKCNCQNFDIRENHFPKHISNVSRLVEVRVIHALFFTSSQRGRLLV